MNSPRPDHGAGLPAAIRSQFGWLRTVAMARLHDGEAAEEVLQNTALAALDAQRRGVEVRQPQSWLYRVLIRQCLLYRRRLGRQRKLVERVQHQLSSAEAGVSAAPGHVAETPLTWLLKDERRQQVREALDDLPHGDAEVLMLKYVEGWSYQQIAEHLGVSQATIESRLFRARKRLRRALASD